MESFFVFFTAAALPVVVAAAVIAGLCITAAWLARPRRVAEVFPRQGIRRPAAVVVPGGEPSPEMKARVAAAASAAAPTADGEETASAGGGGGGRDFEKDGFDDYCTRIFPYFHKWRKAYDLAPGGDVLPNTDWN
ncbi:hypothetical protein OsJ_18960 [Oryza sativa Japonica Group]|uniref:Uncharacterized protein n=1 Tax=Oryza sativa subsp. japonica TaxID=39947 RepID=B9FKT3_ORYSJ|nr:hypothetical protein OsJ_18960 [Oryza sativa Japonica Group]